MTSPICKKAVRLTPQCNEIKKIKKTRLPPIPADFNSRLETSLFPKAQKIWDETEMYVQDLVKFISLAKEAPRSTASGMMYKDTEKADKELAEAQKLIFSVRDRCIHSIAHPEVYGKLSPVAQEELYLYWTTAAQFNRESWCEYYTLGVGYSKFFMVNARKSTETVGLEFEMFSLLTRFSNMFSFDSEQDKQIFSLYLDGFEPVCIADFFGERKAYIEKKISKFTEVALQHREEFLRLSELEQDEIMKEIE